MQISDQIPPIHKYKNNLNKVKGKISRSRTPSQWIDQIKVITGQLL